MSKDNTRLLLIVQMKRAIELLEKEQTTNLVHWYVNKNFAELTNKLHEIRRDSVRFIKECNKGRN